MSIRSLGKEGECHTCNADTVIFVLLAIAATDDDQFINNNNSSSISIKIKQELKAK